MDQILNIEPGSVLWTIITFLVIVWLVGKFGWKPILSGLKSREDSIRNDLETAKSEREKAMALLKEYEASIAGAKKDAADIIQKAQESAAQIKEQGVLETKETTLKMIERAKSEIDRETEAARGELKEYVAELTARATSKLLNKTIDAKQHEELIRDAMKEDV
jgi:F-type H+-transporting ATPase subunit b